MKRRREEASKGKLRLLFARDRLSFSNLLSPRDFALRSRMESLFRRLDRPDATSGSVRDAKRVSKSSAMLPGLGRISREQRKQPASPDAAQRRSARSLFLFFPLRHSMAHGLCHGKFKLFTAQFSLSAGSSISYARERERRKGK